MANYTTSYIEGYGQKRTSFRGEEAYITFFLESDYAPGKLRSAMTPIGTYIYSNGIQITETISELPAIQAFNSRCRALTAPAFVESLLAISALYTQEGDPAWIRVGHPPLIAYIDFIDSQHIKKSPDDFLNANLDIAQTIVIRALRRQKRAISAQHGGSVNYSVEFIGGEVITLPIGQMDIP